MPWKRQEIRYVNFRKRKKEFLIFYDNYIIYSLPKKIKWWWIRICLFLEEIKMIDVLDLAQSSFFHYLEISFVGDQIQQI